MGLLQHILYPGVEQLGQVLYTAARGWLRLHSIDFEEKAVDIGGVRR